MLDLRFFFLFSSSFLSSSVEMLRPTQKQNEYLLGLCSMWDMPKEESLQTENLLVIQTNSKAEKALLKYGRTVS